MILVIRRWTLEIYIEGPHNTEIELTEAELDLLDNNVDEPTLAAFVRAFVKDVIDEGGCGEDEGSVLIVPPTGEIKLTKAYYELVERTDDFSVDMVATLEPH
jgi:hypothetical protein